MSTATLPSVEDDTADFNKKYDAKSNEFTDPAKLSPDSLRTLCELWFNRGIQRGQEGAGTMAANAIREMSESVGAAFGRMKDRLT